MSRLIGFAIYAATCGALGQLIFGRSAAEVVLAALAWGGGALCGGMFERCAHRRRS